MSDLNLDITITLFTEMFSKSFSQNHVAFHTTRAPGTNPAQPPLCTTIRHCPLLIGSKAPLSSFLCQQYFAVYEVSIHVSSMKTMFMFYSRYSRIFFRYRQRKSTMSYRSIITFLRPWERFHLKPSSFTMLRNSETLPLNLMSSFKLSCNFAIVGN